MAEQLGSGCEARPTWQKTQAYGTGMGRVSYWCDAHKQDDDGERPGGWR